MAAVSDFSAKMSRHVSQRFHSSVAPLTEANLYRHTITSPPSREAKLKHILNYVELQRELIALEENLYSAGTDKGVWQSANNHNRPTGSDLAVELKSSLPPPLPPPPIPPHRRPLRQQQQQQLVPPKQPAQPVEDPMRQQDLPEQQQLHHRYSTPLVQRGPTEQRLSPQPPGQTPYQLQQQRYLQNQSPRNVDSLPGGLDPSMALPRALPRIAPQVEPTFHRESFYSGIGQENDWRQLEQLDPDSLAGIHMYGEPTGLQPYHQQFPEGQFSPTTPSSPTQKYPTYEYSPKAATEWQQERHLQQLQQQSIFRQLQSPDDDGEIHIATRHQRQPSFTPSQQQQQQQQRLLSSPPPTPDEKGNKPSRFSSRFSFLTRHRQAQHQRHESVPNVINDRRSPADRTQSPAKFNSLNHRTGGQIAAALAAEDEQAYENGRLRQESPHEVKHKTGNRVKQIFKNVFSKSSSKNKGNRSPESAFRDISLPSTHIIRSSTTPQQYPVRQTHQQHLEPSVHSSLNHYSLAQQRRGLVTPVSRPDTAQSNYRQDGIMNPRGVRGSGNPLRESLVDPLQPHQGLLQKSLESEDHDGRNYPLTYLQDDADSLLKAPFTQKSLTPPPASLVLRHSASSHHLFSHHATGADGESTLTSPAATILKQLRQEQHHQQPLPPPPQQQQQQQLQRTRRSSQLIPIPKDFVDSGCGSTGGHEQYTTGSNATTLHPNNNSSGFSQSYSGTKGHQGQHSTKYEQQHQQQQQYAQLQQQQQPLYQSLPSYDYESGMKAISKSYDDGPTLLSMTQVQKVDLEGLRQNHRHHSASSPPMPTQSHHLGLVAVEAPYA
ncbi:hypothetical protein BGZ75_001764 [Mortierella antarctica]|nr:hypothetical protein BGZ75_001764 [Mortierella antarctica]